MSDETLLVSSVGTRHEPTTYVHEGDRYDTKFSLVPIEEFLEIDRVREIVAFYAEHERYRFALSCGRELFINRFILERGTDTDDWLETDVKKAVTKRLGEGSNERADSLWSRLREPRNWYGHSGFKTDNISSEAKITGVLSDLCEALDDDEYWQNVV